MASGREYACIIFYLFLDYSVTFQLNVTDLKICVLFKILRRGLSTFGAPPAKATVTVHYTMFFENQDEPFDSSELRGRAERYKVSTVTLAKP